ncbi:MULTISPECIES: DUF5683 domain-containing protein [unclassified Mucilaginibacter]|uniref:DUF5683 domain-containing protein n=1 Tax=unclassified Mucilaginibacter TaxID=2617802 RepID=UPI002AC90C37|nr:MULTISPECIES: DUF5683 domain-containing protein [unclassified Mucilaginibacter]MEB0261175.1 DUF5683 domain-containing protein [Mucilaginibacter sp. 10I4]MEB0280347.1 DUF5683 domain-containing protein [Mucilaginibacter sp. 10B2]MEB0300368.1 DUF5683 domain-containing protein [Mucilaginibacter sp. 5C4]WPX24562.1 DUF5683 domain-containing protein [Mucilaginibacter sp. 5C4]
MLKKLLTTVLFLGFAFFAMGQNPDTTAKAKKDTTVVKKVDTVRRTSFAPPIKKEKEYHPDSTHSPSLAVKRSLIIPGWGQYYNRELWYLKVPAIYAGLGLLGNAIIVNQKNYTIFVALAKITRTGGVPVPGDRLYDSYIKYKREYDLYVVNYGASNTDLESAANGYQRNFQISILGVIAVWGIQAVEAYITAKFINAYTVDNNLSFKVTPTLMGQPVYAASNFNSTFMPGLRLTLTL